MDVVKGDRWWQLGFPGCSKPSCLLEPRDICGNESGAGPKVAVVRPPPDPLLVYLRYLPARCRMVRPLQPSHLVSAKAGLTG